MSTVRTCASALTCLDRDISRVLRSASEIGKARTRRDQPARSRGRNSPTVNVLKGPESLGTFEELVRRRSGEIWDSLAIGRSDGRYCPQRQAYSDIMRLSRISTDLYESRND